MKRGLLLVALSIVALVAVVGCSGGANATTGGQATTIKLSEMKFEPATITVPAGQPATISVQNVGTVAHDFSIRGLGQDVSLVVDAGKTATTTFTPTTAGTYEIYCNQPGHEAAGMKGSLVVK